MSAIRFRNSRGELVDAAAFSASEAKNAFGRVLDTVLGGGIVTITKREQPRAVVLSIDEYRALADVQRAPLDALAAEFDSLLQGMQKPASRRAMRSAFAATPGQLGRAAVAAVRRKRG